MAEEVKPFIDFLGKKSQLWGLSKTSKRLKPVIHAKNTSPASQVIY